MKIIKTTLAVLLAASLIGCAASPTANANAATKDIAVTAVVCCSDYSEFSWVPMRGNDIDFMIDEYSQVGQFPEGKSYYAGFALPNDVERMQVELKSWMKNSGVFAPKVMLLDPDFKPVKFIELDDFEVKLSDMFRLSSYRNRFEMDHQTTPYMVVYSPLDYRQGEIQIPHPERVRAEDLGLARPIVTDPVIQHQKFGSLELELKPLNLRSYRAAEKVTTAPVSTKAPVKAPTTAVVAPVPVAAAASTQQPVANTVNTPAMLPETEAFYNSQIKAAVEKNDMHKALQLLEEAKRAGSRSAETTFVELIKK
ncbi:MalM family protein [Photobacterium sp. OFAV2-7]|uniref:MalM family protein n=1 Tax=Photobacterium sp. OFAV2-7 TaxID=2917748 RepID=UPI001EF69055|nr:MalM family protein [Photobacterium sp. OFAV2-7]MCG7587999.1 MalM family protein [Photobacterium sp. OFAV2-7]